MRCDVCGEASRVLETRGAEPESTARRRECPNGHKFTTYEIHSRPFINAKARITQYASAHGRRIDRWKSDQLIATDTRPTSVIAREQHVSPGRIRQIRRGHV